MKDDRTRELGTIRLARFGPEPDRGFNVCEIFIDFDGGGTQGFVFGLGAKKNTPKVRREICELFGVNTEESLKGKRCYALRCFDCYSGDIEGIETMEGLRFTKTGWCRRMGFVTDTALERNRKSTESHINALRRQIADQERKLRNLDESYVDWEK